MKRCLNCGFFEENNNMARCAKCGGMLEKIVEQNVVCHNCGTMINPGNVFCQNCGAPKLEQPMPVQPSPVQPSPAPMPMAPVASAPVPEKKKSSVNPFVWVAVGVFAVIIIGGLVLLFTSNNSDEPEREPEKKTEQTEQTFKDNETKKGGKNISGEGAVATEEKNKEKADKATDDETVVEETAQEYLDLLFAFDDAALDYVDEDSTAYDDTNEIVTAFDSTADGFESDDITFSDEQRKEIEGHIDDFESDLSDNITTEITKVEVKGKTATITCTVKTPDLEQVDTLMEDEDFMYNVMAESLTLDEILGIESMSAEEESELYVKIIDGCFDQLIEELEDTSAENEMTITMKKINGEWLVTEIEGEVL